MNINISNTLISTTNSKYENNRNSSKQGLNKDCFEFSSCKTQGNSNISFKGSFLERLLKKQKPKDEPFIIPSAYIKGLQEGIKETYGESYPTQNFESIMSPKEFKKELTTLSFESFDINNTQNSNGEHVYCADLDCITRFSKDGKSDYYTLLEKVAKIADEYKAKTGKKFTFAVTDLDTVEGVKNAIRIIASEPEKFKNLNFVPSMKMSFVHRIPAEDGSPKFGVSEMLIYGINPFSSHVSDFVDNTLKKRQRVAKEFIVKVGKLYQRYGYNLSEFLTQNRIEFLKDLGLQNIYGRISKYVETKGDTDIKGIDLSAEESYEDTINIVNELYEVQRGSKDRDLSTRSSTLFLNDENFNREIKSIFDLYATVESKDGKIKSPTENTLEDVMALFKGEKPRPVMAIASPYFLSKYFESDDIESTFSRVTDFIKELQDMSEGMLSAFESRAPKYRLYDDLYKCRTQKEFPNDVFDTLHPMFFNLKEQPILQLFNEYLRDNKKVKLYEVGGSIHDPYKDKFTT